MSPTKVVEFTFEGGRKGDIRIIFYSNGEASLTYEDVADDVSAIYKWRIEDDGVISLSMSVNEVYKDYQRVSGKDIWLPDLVEKTKLHFDLYIESQLGLIPETNDSHREEI